LMRLRITLKRSIWQQEDILNRRHTIAVPFPEFYVRTCDCIIRRLASTCSFILTRNSEWVTGNSSLIL
jgi:hypothetical protein